MAVSLAAPKITRLAFPVTEENRPTPEEVVRTLVRYAQEGRVLARSLPAPERGPIINLAEEGALALTHQATNYFNQGRIGSDLYGLVISVAGDSHADLQSLRGGDSAAAPKGKPTWCLLSRWWKAVILICLFNTTLGTLNLLTNYSGHVWASHLLRLLGQ